MKSDQLTQALTFTQVAMDHRDSRIESPTEAIDPTSDSRTLVSACAEQIRPLLLDPAIIAEPVGSIPEAVSRTVAASRSLPHRTASNLDPDTQEYNGPSLYQPQWQRNPENENLIRFTPSGSEAASLLGPISDISQIKLSFHDDFVRMPHYPDTGVAADEWPQADLRRFTGMQGNWAGDTSAETSLSDSTRTPDLVPVSAADRHQRGPANVALLIAGLQNENQGQGQDEDQSRASASRGELFPWSGGGADGLFAATVSPSIARAGPFEMTRGADSVAGDTRATTGLLPDAQIGSDDQPWQSGNGQNAAEGESLGNLTSRLAAIAERLEQAALRLASQAPPRAAAPRPFQGRVDA